MGRIQAEVIEFCKKFLEKLKEKNIGLFVSCMREGETADKQLEESFPEELQKIAKEKEYFGGEFTFSKMKLLDKIIVKIVAKVNRDSSSILPEKIDRFAQAMNL